MLSVVIYNFYIIYIYKYIYDFFIFNLLFYSSEDYSAPSSFLKCSNPTSPKSTISSNGSLSRSMNISSGNLTNEDLIQDECELENYLKEVEQQRKCVLSTNIDQPSNLLSSFWSHPATRTPGEVSPLLRRCAYQLAPTIGKYEINLPCCIFLRMI